MELHRFINQMAANAQRLSALAENVSQEQARWQPGPNAWSILEVICHLRDEEKADFRAHLDLILHRSADPWPRISPEAWATERHYNEQALDTCLRDFLSARKESLDWLRGLSAPDWNREYPAPWGSPIRAGDMLAAWVAHDLLHLRQLIRLHWAYTLRQVQPYTVDYAGDW